MIAKEKYGYGVEQVSLALSVILRTHCHGMCIVMSYYTCTSVVLEKSGHFFKFALHLS